MTADQSRPVSRVSVVEALTQIRGLCDGWSGDVDLADRVRAVLDAVSVDATPTQGIDRDALSRSLWSLVEYVDAGKWTNQTVERARDEVLALVRPVEGVVLSREEAELAAPALRNAAARHAAASGAAWHVLAADLRALASRLEVS